ncbi:MAG: hypothetical protein GF375_00815 [Candidatus Omnitrophica bacterium]|nr:hypothetical protein [Candidatus Omnitrophota bacterium]
MTRRVAPAPAGVPALEPIAQELYDTKDYPIAGTGTLTFFQNPSALGEIETNMVASGQLPYPQQFHAFGICFEIFPGYTELEAVGNNVSWNREKQKLREKCFLRLTIGSKDYLTLPGCHIPEGMGIAGFSAGDDTVSNYASLTQGIQDIKHAFELTVPQAGKIKPIHIPAQQSFKVEIRWPTPLVLAVPEQPVKIRVYLVGILWREVQ